MNPVVKPVAFFKLDSGGNTSCLALNGSDQYLSLALPAANLAISGNQTRECWVKFAALPAVSVVMIQTAIWNSPVAQRASFIGLYNNAGSYEYRGYVQDPSVGLQIIRWPWAGVATDVFYHIGWTYKPDEADVTEQEWFLGGVSQGNGIIQQGNGSTEMQAPSAGNFTVGSDGNGNSRTNGRIDDVRVWDDIRTPTEIADNMSVELVGDEPNLQGYWKMNGGALDSGPNGYDLTENNSPTYPEDPAF